MYFGSRSLSAVWRRRICGPSSMPTGWATARPPERQEMKCVRPLLGAPGGYVYGAAVSAARPPADYTARMIPHRDGVAVPLEDVAHPVAAITR